MRSSPLRRTESHFKTPSGRHLFGRSWSPGEEVGSSLLLVHGFGEHSGRYEDMARWFADRGRSVYAYDLPGHGLSSGKRGHIARFDDFLDDLEFIIDRMVSECSGRRPILIGHSMGGLVATALACERDCPLGLLVTSGPALALGEDISRGRVRAARWLARFLPRFSLQAGLDLEALSQDPEVVRKYREDPLVHGQMSASLAAGMMDRAELTSSSANRVDVPMLLLHGEEDSLCPVDASRSFFSGLDRDRVRGSELRTYAGLRHEIFNEPGREQVYADLLAWVEQMGDCE